MKSLRTTSRTWPVVGVMAASLLLPIVSRAQGGPAQPISNTLTQRDADLYVKRIQEKGLGDPKADQAYQEFHKAKDADKKIKLGEAYINKYPNDWHIQVAYDELVQAYYSKSDMDNFYRCANEGITRFPDDVTLLALSGWVAPRTYKREDPDADAKLDRAEQQEKHALDVLRDLKKPVDLSDQQFDLYKTQISTTAHSALGLIYFRRGKFEESAAELQEATKGAANPDPSDLFVLGADFQNLSQFKEAGDAYNRCAGIAGALQADCKANAVNATKLAAQAK